MQKTLGDGLGLRHSDGWFTIFRDNVSQLEYIRHSQELVEKGLYVALKAYELHVFLDFRRSRRQRRRANTPTSPPNSMGAASPASKSRS